MKKVIDRNTRLLLEELSLLMQERSLTPYQVAAHAGTSELTIRRWLGGVSRPQSFFRQRLPELIWDLENLYPAKITPGRASRFPLPPPATRKVSLGAIARLGSDRILEITGRECYLE